MNASKLAYGNYLIRRWLFKVSVLVSVFAFSGFNLQAYSTFNQSLTTELVETRVVTSSYKLTKERKKHKEAYLAFESFFSKRSWNKEALIFCSNVIEAKFRIYKLRMLQRVFIRIDKPVKIPTSSTEEASIYSVKV